MCVLHFNFPFLMPIILKILYLNLLYQCKHDITSFTDLHLFSKSSLGGRWKIGFRWVPVYLFSDMIFCNFFLFFWYLHLIFLFILLLFTYLLFPLVSLVSFLHRPIVIIFEDIFYVNSTDRCLWIIKSSRRWSGSHFYLSVTLYFWPYLIVAYFIL